MARRALQPGENVAVAGRSVTVAEAVPVNHKLALTPMPKGATIRKFGQPIGSAATDIAPGQWVHVHNVSIEREKAGYEFSTELVSFPTPAPGTFQGYRRKNGAAGLLVMD